MEDLTGIPIEIVKIEEMEVGERYSLCGEREYAFKNDLVFVVKDFDNGEIIIEYLDGVKGVWSFKEYTHLYKYPLTLLERELLHE